MRTILIVFLLAFSCVQAQWPTTGTPSWSIPRTSKPPLIDGCIQEREWADAACITGFRIFCLFGQGYAKTQTWVYSSWDKDYWYLGFRTPHLYREMQLINVRGRDATCYNDEAFELHFWANDSEDCYTFITGLASLYDAKNKKCQWNAPHVTYHVKQHDGFFDAELAIPWQDVNITPQKDMIVRAVLGHDSVQNSPPISNWSQSHRTSYYYKSHAAVLHFSEQSPIVRIKKLGNLNSGQFSPLVEIINPLATDETLNCTMALLDSEMKTIESHDYSQNIRIKKHGKKTVMPKFSVSPCGKHYAFLRIGERCSMSVPVNFEPQIKAQIESFPSQNKINVLVDASSLAAIGQLDMVTVQFGAHVQKHPYRNSHVFTFDTKSMALGKHDVTVTVFDNRKQVLNQRKLSWEKLNPTPTWMTHPVAAKRIVPPPFVPLVENNLNITVGERKLDYKNTLIARDIQSKGKTILPGPIRVILQINGKTTIIAKAKSTLKHKENGMVQIEAMWENAEIKLKAVNQLEFDGMQWTGLTMTPIRKNLTIDLLQIDFPLASDNASLMHWNNCTLNAASWTGTTPNRWLSPFRPVVWFGNEYVGWCWFAESYQDWHNQSDEKLLLVRREAKKTTFTMNIIDRKTRLRKPVTYKFGFTVLPAKKMPDGWLGERPIHESWWDESNQFLHEALTVDQWQEAVRNAQSQGKLLTKYTQTNYLSFYGDMIPKNRKRYPGKNPYRNTPEKLFWVNEWQMLPKRGLNAECPTLCSNTPWRDLVVAGIEQRIRLGHFPGIYFDCAMPKFCNNTLHGCKGAYDILGQRDIRRRVYNIYHSCKQKPLIWEHNSDIMIGPIMNFATYHYDGEQWSNYVDNYIEKLPLDRMRAFSIGTNWGHVPVFMAFLHGGWKPTNSLLATWCLHMPTHFINGWMDKDGVNARKLDQLFGFGKQTIRKGYWENAKEFTGQTKTIKATAYCNPETMMLVVSNLAQKPQSIAIGIPQGNWHITHDLGNQKTKSTLSDHTVKNLLAPESCTIIILKNDPNENTP